MSLLLSTGVAARAIVVASLLGLGEAACGGRSGGPIADPTVPIADPTLPPTDVTPTDRPPPRPAPAVRCWPQTVQSFALSNSEYEHTVRDLLGISGAADAFAPEWFAAGQWVTPAPALSDARITEFKTAADALAVAALSRVPSLVPCDPAVLGEDACATRFIAEFGRRAYRRLLTGEETAALREAYSAGRAAGDFPHAITAVIAAALKSPHFYLKGRQTAGERSSALSPYEMASRLSYFLYRSMPDEPLFAAAAAGQLATDDDVAAQARRMLDDPKARDGVNDFFTQLLGLDQLDVRANQADTSAETAALYRSMKAETLAFASWVFFVDGRWPTLLTSHDGWVNEPLAQLYGVAGVSGPDLRRVQLDPNVRSGVLTQASLLSLTSHPDDTSPPLRGKLILEALLCRPIPPPPLSQPVPFMKAPGETTRAALARSTAPGDCLACHALMDPFGDVLEGFDLLGRARATDDNGLMLDTAVTFSGGDSLAELKGSFAGPIDLAVKLASSQVFSDCGADQWLRFALPGDRPFESSAVSCDADAVKRQWRSSGKLVELIMAIVRSQSFLNDAECIPFACGV